MMTPGKLISTIAVLILLTLAAEGGYYWGFNRGLKNAPAASIPAQTPVATTTPIFSGKDPADIQAATNALALLFKLQVIDHLKGVPPQAVWWSGWSINIGGKLAFLGDKEISLELTPDQGVKTWALPPFTGYRIYNETTRQSNDAAKETIQLGDTVGFSVQFDTRTGEATEASVTKSVKN